MAQIRQKIFYDGRKTVVSGRELIHECRELLELNHRDQELALVKILTNNITETDSNFVFIWGRNTVFQFSLELPLSPPPPPPLLPPPPLPPPAPMPPPLTQLLRFFSWLAKTINAIVKKQNGHFAKW